MFAKKLDHDLQRFGTIVRPVGDSSVDKQPLLAHLPKRYARLLNSFRNETLHKADGYSGSHQIEQLRDCVDLTNDLGYPVITHAAALLWDLSAMLAAQAQAQR